MTNKSLIPLILTALFVVFVSKPVYALIRIDLNGNITQSSPSVLGDEDDKAGDVERDENQEPKEAEEQNEVVEEQEQIEEEKQKEAGKKEIERVREQLKKNDEEEQKIRETNSEIVKKIEEEDKEQKQESIEQIKIQSESSMKILVASESGETEEIEDKEIEMEIEHGVVSFKNSPDDSSIEITQGSTTVHTELSLNIDPKTQQIFVESEGKEFEVKILPEEAVKLVSDDLNFRVTPSGSLERLELVVENGQVLYLIDGVMVQKLLGLFTVTIPTEVKVSGVSGFTLASKQSLLSRVLDFLSI
ncbi:MAG: hypothetical protein AAB965_02915 [Patescibacteria group bacterium]